MIIYLDNNYICHLNKNENIILEIETTLFDDFAPEIIQYYRYIPKGHIWTNTDGVQFVGEMITPWVIGPEIERIQWKYDKTLCEEYKKALEIYENLDIEGLNKKILELQEENILLTNCILEMSEMIYN